MCKIRYTGCVDRPPQAPYAGAMATARKRKAVQESGVEARICDAVHAAILERRLAPGTKLPEAALGARFAVSRTIVRQALRTLAHEGIVALRDRRVAVVARPSPQDVANVFEARRAVECSLVELVVTRASRAHVASLRRLVRDEEAAYRRGDRVGGLARSLAFHRDLGRLCGNPVLERYLNEMVLRTSLAVALYEEQDAAHSHAPHGQIVEAIAERDGRRAARLMRDHLGELERALAAPGRPPSLDEIFGRQPAR